MTHRREVLRSIGMSAASMGAGRAIAAASLATAGCAGDAGGESYEAAARRIWRPGLPAPMAERDLATELVRCATLAPSSHNTQCWKFALEQGAITILPDLARRCPVVDPDDHHLFVSLGCAAENLVQAALAHGLRGEAEFDEARTAVRITLSPVAAEATELFNAIAARQSTRAEYDGKPVAPDALKRLELAARSERVGLLLLTDRPALENVLDFVVQGNTAQMNDKAFVDELKTWIRFNGADAVRLGDGLFGKSSGNPEIPGWLGDLMFGFVFTPKAENEKYAKNLRSSAGVAVFAGAKEDKAHWVEVGRSFERFTLQATALGIRTAHVNMPVEVASLRPEFAKAIGLGHTRPDLVIRFGRGPTLPPSLRRPVQAVLV
jgi:nitroreductase